MKICVIGLGYIGLPTSVAFGLNGSDVVGVDVNKTVVDDLNAGNIHIEEPGLEDSAKELIRNGKFHASTKPERADAYIVAVPTPYLSNEAHTCDLGFVLEACRSILPFVSKGNVVIIESTIAPRSTDDYVKPIFEQAGFKIGTDLYLAHCPERVMPGKIMSELVQNNRIVGGITPACADAAANVYSLFVKGEILKTEARTAEMAKCMENTYRDVNIGLANELAMICDRLEINCLDVIALANKHPRVNILQPGPGVGGHCLAIDPYFIYAQAPKRAQIIKLSMDTNNGMPYYVLEKAEMLLGGIQNARIAVLGVTYKGNTNDERESPALEIIELLEKEGYELMVCDPHVANPEYFEIMDAVTDADMALVLADHDEFKALDHKAIAAVMRRPVLFDTKNIVREQPGSGLKIINYGNLYKYKRQFANRQQGKDAAKQAENTYAGVHASQGGKAQTRPSDGARPS